MKARNIIRKRIALALVSLLIIVILPSCASKSERVADDYLGKTFRGITPWDTEVSISIDKYEDKTIHYTYEESCSGDNEIVFSNRGDLFNDCTFKLDFGGTKGTSNYSLDFHYVANVELKDGQLLITYIEGYKTEVIAGETKNINIEDYTEDERTVALEKK